jgi:hypothetical protein
MFLVHANTMKKKWDNWGIGLSGLCLIHCVTMAVLPLILPLFQDFFDLWFHVLMSLFVLFTSFNAFAPRYKAKGWQLPHWIATFALFMINLGLVFEFLDHHSFGHLFTIIGSLSLVLAHIWNLKHPY